MLLTRLLGIILIAASIVAGVGGQLPIFVNVPSIAMVVGLSMGAALLGGRNLGNAVACIVGKTASASILLDASKTCTDLEKYSIGAGLIGTLTGFVLILANMDDPSKIGAGAAIALLTLFYSCCAKYLLLSPLARRLEDKAKGL